MCERVWVEGVEEVGESSRYRGVGKKVMAFWRWWGERLCKHVRAGTRAHAHTRTRTHAHTRVRAYARTRVRAHARTRAHANTIVVSELPSLLLSSATQRSATPLLRYSALRGRL